MFKFTSCDKTKIVVITGIGIIASIIWINYKFKQKKEKTIYQIVDIKTRRDLSQQTVELLDSEWKDQSQRWPILSNENNDNQELNEIPVTRILIKISPISIFDLDTMMETVIGHIHLKESYRDITLSKLQKMLKVGLPISAIKERAKHGEIDLNDPIFYDQNGNLTFDNALDDDEICNKTREIYIGSLLIDKQHRRNGFARILLSESLIFVHNLGYGKLYGQAAKKLVGFYEKLGGSNELKKKYRMNAISTMITDEMVKKCKENLKHSKFTLQIAPTLLE